MKIEKLSKKLADNLLYYHNKPEKRCYDSERGSCRYSGKTLGLNTPGCFIGRLLPAKNRELLDKKDFGSFQDVKIFGGRIEENFPKYMLDNVDLMTRFQLLHDNPNNWSIIGLNEYGKEKLKNIIERFNLVEEDFKPILLKSELEVLVETLDYYVVKGNPRSVNSFGGCVYHGENGSKCAFSRVCEEGSTSEEDEGMAAGELLNKKGFDILQPEYSHLVDIHFWDAIQKVHDVGLKVEYYESYSAWYNSLRLLIENNFNFSKNDSKKLDNYLKSIESNLTVYFNKNQEKS